MEYFINLAVSWQFLLVAAACGAFGIIIKQIPRVASWIIPIVNAIFAIVAMLLLTGFTVEAALTGFLAAAIATYVYELIVQVLQGKIRSDKSSPDFSADAAMFAEGATEDTESEG